MVTLPAIEGQIGIYPQHVRLITQIVPGEIIVTQDGAGPTSSPSAKGSSRSRATTSRSSPTWRSRRAHRRSQGRRSARARRRPAAREDLGRGSRHRQRVAGALAGAAAGQAAAQRCDPLSTVSARIADGAAAGGVSFASPCAAAQLQSAPCPEGTQAPQRQDPEAEPIEPAPVLVGGEPVIWVMAGAGPYTPQYRAERIRRRVRRGPRSEPPRSDRNGDRDRRLVGTARGTGC